MKRISRSSVRIAATGVALALGLSACANGGPGSNSAGTAASSTAAASISAAATSTSTAPPTAAPTSAPTASSSGGALSAPGATLAKPTAAKATPVKPSVDPLAVPTGFPKHDPKLKEVKALWARFDVPAGWSAREVPAQAKGKVPSVNATHLASGSQTQIGPIKDVRIKGAPLRDANAGMCGAFVQARGEMYFQPGWQEGPIDSLSPAVGVGFSCGIKGKLKTESRWGAMAGKDVEMLITTLAKPNGNAIYQFYFSPVTPVKGSAMDLRVSGHQAALMLRQAASQWYGETAW